MYALIRDNQIIETRRLRETWWDGTRWWDFSDTGHDPADHGWLPLVYADRPADTAATTWERDEPRLIDGVPTVGWVERDKTAEELQAEADAAAARARYETHQGILDATAAVMENAHEDGQPWVQPTGAHDAYPLGRTVTHNGKTWESTVPANVWEPGVSGWREVVSEGYPTWVRPTGAHDAYNTGDRVSFEGSNYESTIDGNTWSPTEHPEGWTLIP